jgi:cytochrome c oxidase subunit 1
VGAAIIAVSVALFAINVLWSARRGAVAGADPWGAPGLEWATTSPPPAWNFQHIPIAESRSPLWSETGLLPVATGLRSDRREILVTSALDAVPDNRHEHPGPTYWPLVMALAIGVTFIGAVFTPWGYVIGFLFAMVAFAGWAWPRGGKEDDIARNDRMPTDEEVSE